MIDHLVVKLVLLSFSCQMYFDSSVLLESFLLNKQSELVSKCRHENKFANCAFFKS